MSICVKALLVHNIFSAGDVLFVQEEIDEFKELACSANFEPANVITCRRQKPDAKYFLGEGKVEEIRQVVQQQSIDVVLINHTLTPSQERNLQKVLQCRILDRTELILEIFAHRAKTFEGKLQVELAQLKHAATRLVRGWTHLERQKGGIGLRGGPGETQLEVDRRIIRRRIETVRARLEDIRKQRSLRREKRYRSNIATISLVGYTNAGKSTLFNRLTASQVYVANQLFATLDPTLRKIDLPYVGEAVLADTVGFIRHLPHDLIDAFRATLEESKEADLLIHVVDAASPQRSENIQAVNNVLIEISADQVPRLIVFNKIDLLEKAQASRIDRDQSGVPVAVWISAMSGEGLELLLQAIAERLNNTLIHCCLKLKPTEAAIKAKLYQQNAVVSENHTPTGEILLEIKVPEGKFQI
ncbi:MAG: GTPase HflX [Gammaproteobacteria bacterium GWF2_41_13]|nr:MAG: GTPase HflX [Gammaproteobacteria bacterium GWF2_41_13]